MKTLGVQSKFLALAVSVGVLSLGATLSAAPGTASLTQATGAVNGASAGDALPAGSVISTQAGSQAVININGDTVILDENSTLSIDTNEAENTGVERVINVQLTLSAGRVYGEVAKFSSLSKFVIKIPKGTVGVDASEESTVFDVSANGDVRTTKGSIDVLFNRGTATQANVVAQNLRANQRFDPGTGNVAPDSGPDIGTAINLATVRVATPTQPVQPFQFFISPKLGRN